MPREKILPAPPNAVRGARATTSTVRSYDRKIRGLDVIPIAPKTGGGERQKPTILMRAPLMKKWLLEPALRKQASSEERRLLPFRPLFFRVRKANYHNWASNRCRPGSFGGQQTCDRAPVMRPPQAQQDAIRRVARLLGGLIFHSVGRFFYSPRRANQWFTSFGRRERRARPTG